jgi:hypothetical protein
VISTTSFAAQRLLLPRSGREVLFVILTLLSLPFFFINGPGWLSTDTGKAMSNLGHIPFFVLVTLLIRSRFFLKSAGGWLTVSLAAFALGGAIELIQSLVGRSASWHDVLRNLTGTWLVVFWLQRPTALMWFGRVVATSLLVIEMSLLVSKIKF